MRNARMVCVSANVEDVEGACSPMSTFCFHLDLRSCLFKSGVPEPLHGEWVHTISNTVCLGHAVRDRLNRV